jgi:hypothetical protein
MPLISRFAVLAPQPRWKNAANACKFRGRIMATSRAGKRFVVTLIRQIRTNDRRIVEAIAREFAKR